MMPSVKGRVAVGLGFGILRLRLIAGQVGLGLTQRGLVPGQIGLRLVQGGFERPRVDGEQQVALFDEVAFLEIDLGQLAADLGLNRDGGIGLHVADDLNFHRHVLLVALAMVTGTSPIMPRPRPPLPPGAEPAEAVPAFPHPAR